VGERRIGLALSDPAGVLASPLGFIDRTSEDEDVRRVLETAREHRAERLVVGIPLSLSGVRGPQARAVEGFRRSLSRASDLPVAAWDERFSTLEAERRLRESGVRPSLERGRTDAASAAIILQGYLDSLKGGL
jgi:putative Holliday junction resolvase